MLLVFWIKLGYQSPKTTTVISLNQVTNFMNNDIVDNLVGSHY